LTHAKKAGVKKIVLEFGARCGRLRQVVPHLAPESGRQIESERNRVRDFTAERIHAKHDYYLAPSIRAQGVFYDAMGTAKTSYIDVRDVAGRGGKDADDGRTRRKDLRVEGPEAIAQDDLAKRIAAKSGREVKHVNIPREAHQKAMLDLGMPAWQVTALIELQDYYVSGRAAAVDAVVEKSVGKASEDDGCIFDEYANEFRA